MSDDRLAALLHEAMPHDQHYTDDEGHCTLTAARLRAAGVTLAPELDVERLALALSRMPSSVMASSISPYNREAAAAIAREYGTAAPADLRNLLTLAEAACEDYGATRGRVVPSMELLNRAVRTLRAATPTTEDAKEDDHE